MNGQAFSFFPPKGSVNSIVSGEWEDLLVISTVDLLRAQSENFAVHQVSVHTEKAHVSLCLKLKLIDFAVYRNQREFFSRVSKICDIPFCACRIIHHVLLSVL